MNRVDNLVSVIMPAFNASNYISEAINSVLRQTHKEVELIIVNDNSTDETGDIINEISKKSSVIKILNLQKNEGVACARNAGLKIASGRYISFLDADDLWMPEKIKVQLETLHANNACCCHSSYKVIGSSGDYKYTVYAKDVVSYEDMLNRNHIGNLTGLYDALRIGIWYQKDIGHEDYLMWLNIIKNNKSFGVLEPMAMYRLSENGVSQNKLKAARWHFHILTKELGINYLKSLCHFVLYVINGFVKKLK